jgi:hypothetical protein
MIGLFLKNDPEQTGPFASYTTAELRLMYKDCLVNDQDAKLIFTQDVGRELDRRSGIINAPKTQFKVTASPHQQQEEASVQPKVKAPKETHAVFVVFQDRSRRGPILVGLFTEEQKAIATCRKKTHFYIETSLNKLTSSKAERIFPKLNKKGKNAKSKENK